jgi:hypothetical protein
VVILSIRGEDHFDGEVGWVATAAQAFDQVVELLESFEALEDHRQRAKVLYPLDEILLLALVGVRAGCESWVEIAKFGDKKLDLLRRFRPYRDGTPSHDQLGDIFAALDAAQFQSCFIAGVGKLTGFLLQWLRSAADGARVSGDSRIK